MESQDVGSIISNVFHRRANFIRFAQSYVVDEETAEDIVMDSFVYFWERRDEIDTGGNVSAYILTVVKHKCLDWLRRQQVKQTVREQILDDAQWELEMNIATLEAIDPNRIYEEEFQELVRHSLMLLPEKTRRIFMLSRMENKSYGEIAEVVGLSQKSVEFHMSKALRQLRHDLKDYFLLFLLFWQAI